MFPINGIRAVVLVAAAGLMVATAGCAARSSLQPKPQPITFTPMPSGGTLLDIRTLEAIPQDYWDCEAIAVGWLDRVDQVADFSDQVVPSSGIGWWRTRVRLEQPLWIEQELAGQVGPDSQFVVFSLGEPNVRRIGQRVVAYALYSEWTRRFWGNCSPLPWPIGWPFAIMPLNHPNAWRCRSFVKTRGQEVFILSDGVTRLVINNRTPPGTYRLQGAQVLRIMSDYRYPRTFQLCDSLGSDAP